jgi:glycine amidinotransferase
MIPVNSHNEWSPIQEVIVGTVFDHNMKGLDLSFKLFFHDNLFGQDLYGCKYDKDVVIKQKYVQEMGEDLEGFVTILEDYGARVRRPKTPDKVTNTQTPYWKSTDFYALNVRDQTIIVGNEIIETPPTVRYRYFENDLMKHLFLEYFKRGAKWTVCPRPLLLNSSFDIGYVIEHCDEEMVKWFEDVTSEEHPMSCGYEIIFDAANCMRFGNTILMNAVTDNQHLGAQWLRQHLGDDYRVETIGICDSHIDSCILPLREGLLLVDWTHFNDKTQFPDFLKDWDIIEAPIGKHEEYDYDNDDIMLASKSIDANVFSLDENNIVCHDTTYKLLQPLLKPYGINCIPCRFRHSRIFSGAFHCTTLDIRRDSKLENYFS